MKLKLTLLLLGLTILTTSTCLVSAAVIEDYMIFGEFDINGGPVGEQLVFGPDDDFVGVWFDLSDVSQGDEIIIEFLSPNGDEYVTLNWTAPSWIEDGSTWDFWEDIEVHGDWRAADPSIMMYDAPGTWTAHVTVNGTWWDHLVFEVVSVQSDTGGSTDTSTDDDTKIRGYYVHVTDVNPVGQVTLGQNATVEATVEYNFMHVPLVVSILDDQFEPRGTASDEIGDYGESKYTLSMTTQPGDSDKVFYAVAHYFIDGNWTFMEPGGYMMFTLEGGSLTPDSSGGIGTPGFDISDIDMDQITSTLNDSFQRGLDILKNVEVPDELSGIEETIKERTGIPGFPVGALVAGVSLIGLALRRRD